MQVRPLSRAINSDGNPDAVGHGGADAARGVEGMLLDNTNSCYLRLFFSESRRRLSPDRSRRPVLLWISAPTGRSPVFFFGPAGAGAS